MDCIVHGITKYGPSTLIPGLGRTPREGSASGVLLVALEWLPTQYSSVLAWRIPWAV